VLILTHSFTEAEYRVNLEAMSRMPFSLLKKVVSIVVLSQESWGPQAPRLLEVSNDKHAFAWIGRACKAEDSTWSPKSTEEDDWASSGSLEGFGLTA
jgi:hypothetical protein